MQEIELTVSGNDAPIPLAVESGKIIHDGGLPSGGTTGQVLTKASDADGDADWQTPSDSAVQDVQVNGVSVLQDGVANVPYATDTTHPGVVKAPSNSQRFTTGTGIHVNNGLLSLTVANSAGIKNGASATMGLAPSVQHEATFYGLAKAAGDTTQSASNNAVGNYTESAKSAISEMLNGSVAVTGTTPTITALPGVRYVCGEVSTLDITLPASGCVDVVFESGSTATMLTVTPPTGKTLSWTGDFDPTALETDTVYEINVAVVGDKCLGVAGTWT